MMPLLQTKTKVTWAVGAAICTLVFLSAILMDGFHHRSPRREHLEHFDGDINQDRQTYDRDKSALYVLASRALKAGEADTAAAIYREAIAKYPNDPAGYEALGACFFFQAKYREAKAEYLRAIASDAHSVGALYGLGCIAYQEGYYATAEDHLRRALTVGGKDGLCHRLLGMVHDQMGEMTNSLFHYQRAIEVDPAIAKDAHVSRRLMELKQ